MDTIVHLSEPLDFGGGPQDVIRLPDSGHTVNGDGSLAVWQGARDERAILTLGAEQWTHVVTGDLTFNADPEAVVRRSL